MGQANLSIISRWCMLFHNFGIQKFIGKTLMTPTKVKKLYTHLNLRLQRFSKLWRHTSNTGESQVLDNLFYNREDDIFFLKFYKAIVCVSSMISSSFNTFGYFYNHNKNLYNKSKFLKRSY